MIRFGVMRPRLRCIRCRSLSARYRPILHSNFRREERSAICRVDKKASQQAVIRDLCIACQHLVASRHFARRRKVDRKSSFEENDLMKSSRLRALLS